MYRLSWGGRLWSAALMLALTGAGLSVLSGCPGAFPGPGAGSGTLRGVVTNEATEGPLAGAVVTLAPVVEDADEITTDAEGQFTQAVPAGVYTVTVSRSNFASVTRTLAVNAGATTTLAAALAPNAPVVVTATVEGAANPGGTLTARASVEVLDGATTVSGYAWSGVEDNGVTIANGNSANATVTLPAVAAFKEQLIHVLGEPPISADQLPPNVPLPEGEFPGGYPNRFHIMGVNPLALEHAGLVTLKVTVTTSAGTFEREVEVHANLPWAWSQGLRNVPIGVPLLLAGKDQASYGWTLAGPAGSSATLADATTRYPYFTPDVAGTYRLTVTDLTGENPEQITMEIYAGEWAGAITGQDANGLPEATGCTVCHTDGGLARDYFTPWAQTGHAHIFTTQIETSDHYSESCMVCHTVGLDKSAENGGIDDAADYAAFLTADFFHHIAGDNWETILADFPDTASLANIQCENCHGPNTSQAHTKGAPRVSLSSNVCGTCHGEPLRHGRFQQWQLSGHANYELAMDEGGNGSCARCHTAQGFLQWLPILMDDDPATNPATVTVDWDVTDSEPVTCAVCHDPHNIGTVSGDGTNAPVRITDNTPPLPGGFTAVGVGKGAICFTCHNSRNGTHDDSTFANFVGTVDATRAPHGSAQGDVVMGRNAYQVNTGIRGPHAYIDNTCVTCHMQETPAPDLLAYQQGGTNHTFFASGDVCAKCHGEVLTADGIQAAFDTTSETLQALIEEAMVDLIGAQIDQGNTVVVGTGASAVEITSAAQVVSVEFGEASGRQSIAVTLSNGATTNATGLNNVTVVDAADNNLGSIYNFADERLIKAGWNWNLANNDSSKGVHNPPFVFEFMDASIDGLTALANE